MITKYYKSLDERNQIVTTQHDAGLRMLHDDHIDINNKPTDGKTGKLVFVNQVEDPIIDVIAEKEFQKLKELQLKLDNDSITFTELKEYMRLRNG